MTPEFRKGYVRGLKAARRVLAESLGGAVANSIDREGVQRVVSGARLRQLKIDTEPLTSTGSVWEKGGADACTHIAVAAYDGTAVQGLRAVLEKAGVKYEPSALDNLTSDEAYNEMVENGTDRPYKYAMQDGGMVVALLYRD